MAGSRRPGSRRLALIVGASISIVALVGGPVAAEEGGDEGRDLPVEFVHNNLEDAPVAGAVWAGRAGAQERRRDLLDGPDERRQRQRQLRGHRAAQRDLDRGQPDRPEQPDLGGANDYQLAINPGGHVTETMLSRAHVTFDGGHTGPSTRSASTSTYQATGDPAVAFDASGQRLLRDARLPVRRPDQRAEPGRPRLGDSDDGGKTWDAHRVAQGSGNFTSRRRPARQGVRRGLGQRQRDRHLRRLPARPEGRASVRAGSIDSVTHDAARRGRRPCSISGDALVQAFCRVPTVTADGRIFVAFLNTTDTSTTGRDDYEVVEVEPDHRRSDRGPVQGRHADRRLHRLPDRVRAADLPGPHLPLLGGRQHHGRSRPNATHLAVVWSDMRNSTLPAPDRPVRGGDELRRDRQPVVRPRRGPGPRPVALALRRRPVHAWGAYDATGSCGSASSTAATTRPTTSTATPLATETGAGTLSFSTGELSTVRSDPTKGNRWFAATLERRDFPFATSFIGDYSNIAATPSGGVVAVWTDLRNQVSFAGRTGADEDVYFATSP